MEENTTKKPVGIYYHKPTKTHGSRYEVDLKRVVKDGKRVRWKTTSTPFNLALMGGAEFSTSTYLFPSSVFVTNSSVFSRSQRSIEDRDTL